MDLYGWHTTRFMNMTQKVIGLKRLNLKSKTKRLKFLQQLPKEKSNTTINSKT